MTIRRIAEAKKRKNVQAKKKKDLFLPYDVPYYALLLRYNQAEMSPEQTDQSRCRA